MAYQLHAVIGPAAVVARVEHAALGRAIALTEEWAMRVLREPDDVAATEPDDVAELLGPTLAAHSHGHPLAYVGISTFGGSVDANAGLVWADGVEVFRDAIEDDSPEPLPSNVALRLIGVQAPSGSDEFDALGLGRHRSTDDWG